MSHWNFRRSANSVQLLAKLGLDHGMPLRQSLKGTGLEPAQLDDPHLEIDAHQELQVVRNLHALLKQTPAFGLLAGLNYQLTAYGIFGFAIISSSTFRSAVRTALSYLELSFIFCRLRVEEQGSEFHLVLEDKSIPADVRDFLLERDAAAIRLIQRELFSQPIPLLRLELRRKKPVYAAEFQKIFGLMPLFGQPDNRMVIATEIMDRPLPRADQRTAQLCEMQCRELLQRRKTRTGMAYVIRNYLLESPGQVADMEQLAQRLHMTTRTLRRKLKMEGTSYRALLDEVREALAEELLKAGNMSVEGVAERLGYAEASSFIHAFKRWKGMTPRTLR